MAHAGAQYDVVSNRGLIEGLLLGSTGYGISLTLFCLCFRRLCPYVRHNRKKAFLMAFVCATFILSTFGNAFGMQAASLAFVTYRDFSGGPYDAMGPLSSGIAVQGSNTVYVISSWLQDGLLLYRFWVIYSGNFYILIFPTLMYSGTFIISCFFINSYVRPGSTLWAQNSINIGLVYWSMSISFTVVVTVLIVGRLLFMRRRLQGILGKGADLPYVSITAMLIESAALWTVTGVVFLGFYGSDNPLGQVFLSLLGQITTIAPLLIILRVAEGQAWSKDTLTKAGHQYRSWPNAAMTAKSGSGGAGSNSGVLRTQQTGSLELGSAAGKECASESTGPTYALEV